MLVSGVVCCGVFEDDQTSVMVDFGRLNRLGKIRD